MERELKRNLGDVVWFINENKVTSGTIKSISYCKLGDMDEEGYSVVYGDGHVEILNEKDVFSTRGELIESL